MNKKDNFSEIKSQSWIEITNKEFEAIRKLVYDKLGINLTEEKRALVSGRLQKLLRKEKFNTFSDYYDCVLKDKSGHALSTLANTISTNHTFFYREKDHFDYFQKIVLPEIENQCKLEKSNDIRIWSAGCSSGEEPYMLVILMMEYFGKNYGKYNSGVLATDISEDALNKAIQGVYSDERINELPQYFKKKYFNKLPDGNWEISNTVRSEVIFRRFNLMNKQFPFKKQFHSIFCRNVMIYFDLPTRQELVDKFYKFVRPDGYLFIGHSETLQSLDSSFSYVSPAMYKKI